MTATIALAHHTRGRTRFKLKPAGISEISKWQHDLKIRKGIINVRYDSHGGSLVVHHALDLNDLVHFLEKISGISIGAPQHTRRRVPSAEVSDSMSRIGKAWDGAIQKATAREMDFKLLSAFGLVGLSIYQWRRGKFLPAGLPMAMQALTILMQVPVPPIEADG